MPVRMVVRVPIRKSESDRLIKKIGAVGDLMSHVVILTIY